MRHLPEIVLNEIFSYLAVRDLCACCCVCRKWSGILHSESAFWENRLSRETPQAFEDNPLIQKLPTAKHKLAAYQSTWSSEDHSENIYVKDDKITIHRNPVALSSDLARGRKGYSSGEHYWTVMWHGPKFGSNAIVGIATKDSNRHCEGYHPLLGMCKNSWGWDLSRCVLRHNGEELGDYPSNNGEIKVELKKSIGLILDMNNKTLSFDIEGRYLGVAFSNLPSVKLYPAISAVYGNTEVSLVYWGQPLAG